MDLLGKGGGVTSLPVTAIVFIPVIYKKKGDHSGLITFPEVYQNNNVHISIHQHISRIIKLMLAKGLVPLGTS